MPGQTTRGYHYPLLSDPVNTAVDMGTLAGDVNTDMEALAAALADALARIAVLEAAS